MEFISYPEDSKSSSEETDTGTGRCRSYECVFCKRGFTTAQALGGHMNIHRKDRAKTKPSFPPSSSTKVYDENYADLGFFSANPRLPGNYYSTTPEVDSNYHQIYFPTIRSSQVQYRDPDLFGEDWRRSSSLYTHPFCVSENKEKVQDNSEEDGLDLELRLGHQP